MRLHVVSDLHLDHQHDDGRAFLDELFPADRLMEDVLVVAGDWASSHNPDITRDLFDHVSGLYKHVLVVPGNHEYWRTFEKPDPTPESINDDLLELAKPYGNIHLYLEPEVEVIEGVCFLAGTMWYPQPPKLPTVQQDFVDFRAVNTRREWFFEQHELFKRELQVHYARQKWRKTIVVTHHMPSMRSSDPQFANSTSNHYFVTDMEQEIRRYKPFAWLHGHGHTPADYDIGSTRVVCNPRGYPYEYSKRPPYQPAIIDI